MRVLFIGDLVGPSTVDVLERGLPRLRERLALDLVICNAENVGKTARDPGRGFGMPGPLVDRLLSAGIDVITSGNHGFDAPDAAEVMARERVLRPDNLPHTFPGRGRLRVSVGDQPVEVVNLGTASAGMPSAVPLEHLADSFDASATTLVDLHSDSAWEKLVFAHAVDGRVAAVLGTHEHDATEPLWILPGGTAFVGDVGMTGPGGYPGGFPPVHFASRYSGRDRSALPPYELAGGPFVLGAVMLQIDGRRTTAIERVRAADLR